MNEYINKTPELTFAPTDALPYATRSMLNAPGLYFIRNIKNNFIYIGITKNLSTRTRCHINHLNIKTHDNKLFQEDWDKYGQDSFRVEIVNIFKSQEEYIRFLDIETELICYCRKNLIPIYNLHIGKFKIIKNNRIAKLLNKTTSEQRFAKKWLITFPSGEEREILNLRQFCRENSLDHKAMADIADSDTLQGITHKGFKCKRGSGNIRKDYIERKHMRGDGNASSKKYEITFPDGHTEIIIGLKDFARKHSLCYSNLQSTTRHEGWTCKGFSAKKL